MDTEIDPAEISVWIQQLRRGQAEGIEEAWSRFFSKLVQIAGSRTRRFPGSTIDAEDIVASVFESAWRASKEGRLASIRNCDELWWWLLKITDFKTTDHVRRATKKTSGGKVAHVSVDDQILALISRDPDPQFWAVLDEEFARGLALLGDETLKQIAVMKLEGYTNQEIEERTKLAPATVTRKLRIIRNIWAKEMI